MQRYVQVFALGFILGITVIHHLGVTLPSLPYLVGAAVMLCGLAVIFYLKNMQLTLVLFFSGLLIGVADFEYHITPRGTNHILKYATDLPFSGKTSLYASIVKQPETADRYTLLVVEPEAVEKKGFKGKEEVDGGLVQLKVYPSVGEVYDKLSYGDRIKAEGALAQPPLPNNPGSMDIRTSLKNRGIFAVMTLRDPSQVEILASGGGNWLVHVAVYLKKHMLLTVKKTIPYPESSLLGGVMLRLRTGLSQEIQQEFKATGLSHMLAVSGLHVTIVTAFFMGLFALLHIPKKIAGFFIIFALTLFTLINGAHPPTIRAAIMNSIGVISIYIFGIGIRATLLLTIPIAALAILIPNPLLITEATFSISFAAVLSIGLFTAPCERFFSAHLKTYTNTALFIFALTIGGIFLSDSHFYRQPPLVLYICLALVPLSFLLDRLLKPKDVYRKLPFWLRGMIAAQCGINIGMAPILILYFDRLSLSSPLANFLGIPLIALVLQLGILGGIVDFIPLIGQYLALVLGAFNWLLIKIFLAMAKYLADLFPYPYIQRPTVLFILGYYAALALFTWWDEIVMKLRQLLEQFRLAFKASFGIKIRAMITTTVGVTSLVSIFLLLAQSAIDSHDLTLTLYDPSLSGLGDGGAILITTPAKKHLLIDGFPNQVAIGDRYVDFDLGKMILLPALIRQNITKLDHIILTSLNPARSGGLLAVLQHLKAGDFYDPYAIDNQDLEITCDSIMKAFPDASLSLPKNRDYKDRLCDNYINCLKLLREKSVAHKAVHDGDVIYQEPKTSEFPELILRVLHPPLPNQDAEFSIETYSLVIRLEFGKFSSLICPALNIAGEQMLTTGHPEQLGCDLLVPSPANVFNSKDQEDEFFKLTNPKLTVLQYRSHGARGRTISRVIHRYTANGGKCLRTDRCGAAIITSDGQSFRIATKLPCPEDNTKIPL